MPHVSLPFPHCGIERLSCAARVSIFQTYLRRPQRTWNWARMGGGKVMCMWGCWMRQPMVPELSQWWVELCLWEGISQDATGGVGEEVSDDWFCPEESLTFLF